MRNAFRAVLALAAVGFAGAGCGDTSGLSDRAAVQAAVADQLGGMMDTSYGADGAVQTDAALPSFDVTGAVDTALVPSFWGRIRVVPRGPRPIIERDIVIVGDSATLALTVRFQGLFLTDTSDDGIFNPGAKPMDVTMSQHAVLVRDASRPHGWRAVALTPQNWVPTDPSRQTVAVDSVTVFRNDTALVTVTSADSLFDVVNRIPRFHLGDTVRVVATVSNSTGGPYTPPTFTFLHVRHADATAVRWHRVRMQDDGNGTFERTWVVRRTGRDRFGVDALDAATLELSTADNYRGNAWAIPYRIE
ncbi:MAG TPA: hypothetical protein VFK78_06470 [Gemmatimonadales bacterium]|nr:hypothetical protein [Gemmatimonadales bacterium]